MGWLGQPITDPKEQTDSILNTQSQDINYIKIETKDFTIQFNKQDNRWFITSPIKWAASDINLERLISLTKLIPHSSLPSSEIDISTLGLRFPKSVITLNNDAIVFGDTNKIGSRRYIMVNNMVHLVEDNHLPISSTGLTGLIAKTLLPQSLKLNELKLPQFTLSKTESASWSVDKTFDGYSADQSNQLIAHWQTLESTKIKPYDKKNTPLKKIIASTDNAKIEFFLMSIQPEIIIARADLGVQYHYPNSFYYDLFSLIKQKLPLDTPTISE